jgi:hypothetical protein
MHTNAEWNYGYLSSGYGISADPTGITEAVTASATAVSAVSGVASAYIGLKTMREQNKADEKMYRMQMLQSKQDAATSTQMAKVGLVQAKQQADAQAKVAKTVVMGIGAIAVLGGLLWIGKDLLKD